MIIKCLTSLSHEHLGSNSYILAASTGVSAVLIDGKTMHSVFQLPTKSQDYSPLTGDRAKTLSDTLENVKFVILDEYSMIGWKTLAMISRRCKEATRITDEDFGGLNVVLLGDINQLPPVKDNPLYARMCRTNLALEGKSIIKNFHKKFLLTSCHRHNDERFLKMLNNLSEYNVTNDDFHLIRSRFSTAVSTQDQEQFTIPNALHLFSSKEDVKTYNMKKLPQLIDEETGDYAPIIKITAKDNCSNAQQIQEAEGLQRDLYVAKNCNITLKTNLWVDKKLVNGTQGKIIDILYNREDFPAVILCEFPNYTGPSIIPTKIVPIKPMLNSWTDSNEKKCTRYQFPLCLCYACTIHKSQGITIDKVHI
ncbi:hypothetical protein FOCC_FOCC013714 [Frankliniella occidentalis]|nr:hypothetical protein FOCC_FOCC013714 [Frankliniella occidentalis]